MLHSPTKRLLIAGVLFVIYWVINQPTETDREVVAACMEKHLQLTQQVIESINIFVSEPDKEEIRGNELIASIEAWHQFWIDSTNDPILARAPMTKDQENASQQKFDDLIYAGERLIADARRRADKHPEAHNERLTNRILDLLETNPLAGPSQ